jgi:DHA1 family multidrug resistance protein-like MFS transporter
VPRRAGHRPLRAFEGAGFILPVTALGRAAQNAGQTTYPLIGHELLQLSNHLIGVIVAVAGAAGVLASATIGARATTSNAYRTLAVGQALLVVAFVALAVPRAGVVGLWTSALLLGGAGGIIFPATMTLVGSRAHVPSRALALYTVALSLGLAGGPFIEAACLHLTGQSLHETVAALLPVPVASLCLALRAARGDRRARQPATAHDANQDHTTDAPPRGTGAAPTSVRRPLLALPAYRLALAIMLSYEAPFVALMAFGGLLGRHSYGVSSSGVEIAFTSFFAASLAVRGALVRYSPLPTLGLPLVASVALTAGGLALLGLGHGFAALLIAMAMLGMPHGLTYPLAGAHLAESLSDDLGRANGGLNATIGAVAVAVPLACGWLSEAVGLRGTFLALEVVIALFGSALLVQLGKMGGFRWRAGAAAP